jgi:hypothetical protein
MKTNRALTLALLLAGTAVAANSVADGGGRSHHAHNATSRDNETTRVFKLRARTPSGDSCRPCR